MNTDEALSLLDDWVVENRGQGLSPQQKEIFRRSWEGQEYDDMEISRYSTEYIKKMLAPKLWKLLSQVIEEPVTKNTLRIVIEPALKLRSRQQDSLKPLQGQIWSDDAPELSVFYGYADELNTLEQWIVTDRCRLLALGGMVGVGKTAIAVKLARQIQDSFQFVIWRSLRGSPPLQNILADLLESFFDCTETTLPDTSVSDVSRLMECLRSHRCLVILDGVETILETSQLAGRYREGYQDYGQLFRQIGELNHQSCLVLTCSEKLRVIDLMADRNSPVRYYKLEGLKKDAAKQILKDRELVEEPEWKSLIERYEGNPLLLRIVATTIQEIFNGRASDFIKQNTIFLGNQLTEELDRQFQRISQVEIEVMYQLALDPQPLTRAKLRENIPSSPSSSQVTESLQSLAWRSLIEKMTAGGDSLFTLRPIIRKYVLNRFNQQSNISKQ